MTPRSLAALVLAACGRIGFGVGSGGGDGSIGGGGDGPQLDGVIPPNTNIAFVTSTTMQPGMLGGFTGADMMCATRAAAGHLPGHYVAWLSSSTKNAKDRLGGARGWVRVDGRPFADQVANLLAGEIWYPLAMTELGATLDQGAAVATGTRPDGTSDGGTCGDWADIAGTLGSGVARFGTAYWTELGTPLSMCGTLPHYYCFGIDDTTSVAPPARTSRLAFLSNPWPSGGGRNAADAECQTEATAAGLPGSYQALLADVGTTAIARFRDTGTMWTRVDGVALADSYAQFASGDTIAPLNVTAAGAYVQPAPAIVWTGGVPDATGTALTTCNNWTVGTTGGNAHGGDYDGSGTQAFDEIVAQPCDLTTSRLYCLAL